MILAPPYYVMLYWLCTWVLNNRILFKILVYSIKRYCCVHVVDKMREMQ